MNSNATARLVVGNQRTSVPAESVTIHGVTADAVTVTEIPPVDPVEAFTAIQIDNGSPTRRHNLFVLGTPAERATELLRIAHVLAEAAEALAAEKNVKVA